MPKENESLVRKSSDQILKDGARSLEQMFDDYQALALVLDASGSMGSYLNGDAENTRGRSKESLQKEVVKDYVRSKIGNKLSSMKVSVLSFNDRMYDLLRDSSDATAIGVAVDNIHSGGSTVLAPAIRRATSIVARSLDYIPRIVITSDGQVHDPYDAEAAVREAAEFGVIVDTIFIGPNEYDEGAAFMRKLADLGNGVSERVANSAEFKQKYLKVLDRKLIGTSLK